jgi:hypothetical protein
MKVLHRPKAGETKDSRMDDGGLSMILTKPDEEVVKDQLQFS